MYLVTFNHCSTGTDEYEEKHEDKKEKSGSCYKGECSWLASCMWQQLSVTCCSTRSTREPGSTDPPSPADLEPRPRPDLWRPLRRIFQIVIRLLGSRFFSPNKTQRTLWEPTARQSVNVACAPVCAFTYGNALYVCRYLGLCRSDRFCFLHLLS